VVRLLRQLHTRNARADKAFAFTSVNPAPRG